MNGKKKKKKNDLLLRNTGCAYTSSVFRLVTGGIPSGHYTYIIVDEAGQASEPECLIPISGDRNNAVFTWGI